MTPLIKTLVTVTATALLATGAFAQSTVVNVENEPAPSLTVLPPLPGPLAQGVVFIPYRLANLRIVPVGGAAARDISPWVGCRPLLDRTVTFTVPAPASPSR